MICVKCVTQLSFQSERRYPWWVARRVIGVNFDQENEIYFESTENLCYLSSNYRGSKFLIFTFILFFMLFMKNPQRIISLRSKVFSYFKFYNIWYLNFIEKSLRDYLSFEDDWVMFLVFRVTLSLRVAVPNPPCRENGFSFGGGCGYTYMFPLVSKVWLIDWVNDVSLV